VTELPQKVTVVPCQECAEGRKRYPDALAFRCSYYDIPELGIEKVSKDVAERIAWLWNRALFRQTEVEDDEQEAQL